MAFNAVISTQEGEAYQKEVESPSMIGLTIGEEIDGSLVGLNGYRLAITGGSDSDGFPMREDIPGTGRQKIMMSSPSGYNPDEKGVRKRKSVRGNTVSEDIEQLNLKVVESGDQPIPELWELGEGTEESGEEGDTEEPPEEEPTEEDQTEE